jgi:hypothetical protein
MKKIFILKFIVLILVLILTSCKKEFLENTSKQSLNDVIQFSDENTADIFLNECYNKLWKIDNSPDQPDLYTDDCDGGAYWPCFPWKSGIVAPYAGSGPSAFSYNTPESQAGFDNENNADTYADWAQAFKRIRDCNTFIQQANHYASNFKDASGHPNWLKKRIDEARFLRAFSYSYLFMHYGGVPIITHPQSRTLEGNAAVKIPRSTFEETYNFITSQLDSIYKGHFLPVKFAHGDVDAGRATLGAALALKGWIELFAASPAFNADNPAACNGTGASSDQVKLTGFGNYDVQRWAKAAATNKLFIDSCELAPGNWPYQLFGDLASLWLEKNEYNSEVIYDRQFVAPAIYNDFMTWGGGPAFIGAGAPVKYNWGNFCPTQELIDDYGMANGKHIDEAGSGYDPQHPYVGRDPRFYKWIVYDGSLFKMDWMTTADTVYTRFIDAKHSTNTNQIDFAGADESNTAYYSRKRINPAVQQTNGGTATAVKTNGQNYIFFRYAEVLLNYAEAKNEADGPTGDVYSAIDKIRSRAGVPTLELTYGSLSKDQMRDVLHRERRIELSYENKRIYDIIRWRTAEIVLNRVLHGMEITSTTPYNNSGVWTYTKVPLQTGNPLDPKIGDSPKRYHKAIFHNKMYLLPIPQNAIDQNKKLIQNPGY